MIQRNRRTITLILLAMAGCVQAFASKAAHRVVDDGLGIRTTITPNPCIRTS
jgi:hypothetical protein